MTAVAWFRSSPRGAWHFGPADSPSVRSGACGLVMTVGETAPISVLLRDGKVCRQCRTAANVLGPYLTDLPLEVLQFVAANLGAFEAMARVAKLGGAKHGGGFGPGPGQTAADHIAHAGGHIRRDGSAYNVRTGERAWPSHDDETGELDLAHAATRLVMALTVLGVK